MNRALLKLLALTPMIVLITACSNPPPAEDSCNFIQNAFNRRVSWAKTPVKFYIHSESFAGTDEDRYYLAIKEAMEVWNQAMGREVLQLVGRTSDLKLPVLNDQGRVIPDAYNGIYRVEREVFENTASKDEQARTSISYRGDYIYEADILVDGSETFYFKDESRPSSSGLVQFKSLMIHEFGHALGLGHVDDLESGTVMYPRLQFGQMRPEPISTFSSTGDENIQLSLPEIDKNSLSCEYQ